MLLAFINISTLIILAVAVKHLIYTEKSGILVENNESHNNDCSINCSSGVSTIIYVVPEQQALAWHKHRGGGEVHS